MRLRGAGVHLLSVLASASVLVNAAVPAAAQSAVGQDDPFNVVYSVDIDKDGSLGKLSTSTIPERGFSIAPGEPTPKKDLVVQPRDPSRLQPELEQLIGEGDPNAIVTVVIGLKEDLTIPRFPDLPFGETRDSAVAKELSATQDQLAEKLLRTRQQSQAALIARLQESARLKVSEQFWLVNALVAEMPLGTVKLLLQYDQVQYVQLQSAGEKPPADANPNNDVIDGIARIQSAPYRALPGMAGGFVGLLDTGVRTSHTTFAAPGDHIDFLRDCVNGGTTCNNTSAPGFNTDDNCWNHGTSTASIFTGNANQGLDFQGATAITLDSWKVYDCTGLDSAATVRGFQRGLLVFDRVFIGELQASETHSGVIATAADNAFDAGAVVISANGNFGDDPSTVRSPAIAHKVIGVGAYNVETLVTLSGQSRGPTADGRVKPDIQTPSWTETASTASATAQHVFTGTSGATPYAASAGALLRNWMRSFGLIEPGHVNARIIESGQHVWPYDNEEGAGDLKMPLCGTANWGKVSIGGTGSTVDIPIGVGAGKTSLDVAIWWPERVSEAHDDIDVHIIDPSGVERARGFSAMSIFERARATGPLATGTWKIRIKGFSVASGAQTVYWSNSLHGC